MTVTREHGGRLLLHDRLADGEAPVDLAADVRAGLGTRPYQLPPKYFYDARGSRLFERITETPEYYPTRVETEILQRIARPLAERLRAAALVEFGSGSARKTRILLDALDAVGTLRGYGPVEVSADACRRAADALLRAYPRLRVEGVIGDFEHPHDLPFAGRRRLLVFLGSTIGNFETAGAVAFLRHVAAELRGEDGFLIGFDLVKPVEVLERAYDDAAGVTAAFNRNLLRVLNRELAADFAEERFAHRAPWNPEHSRIEMHLEATEAHEVRIAALDMRVPFRGGERIRTELSHKYTRESAEALLAAADMRVEEWHTDEAGWFAVALAVREGAGPPWTA